MCNLCDISYTVILVEALKTFVLKEKCLLRGGYNGVECVYTI